LASWSHGPSLQPPPKFEGFELEEEGGRGKEVEMEEGVIKKEKALWSRERYV
jgi:hypothetical protein